MAPAPSGGLYVLMPGDKDSVVVALLDSTGRTRAGWPVVLRGIIVCGSLLPVDDGSVRATCSPDDLNHDLAVGIRAFAFDAAGNKLAGWPVDLAGSYTGRVIGDELALFGQQALTDVYEEGRPSAAGFMTTITADGDVHKGIRVPLIEACCGRWAVGPDGVAYRVESVGDWTDGPPHVSRITALDLEGVRPGWPIKVDGAAFGPEFEPDGRIIVRVGSSGSGKGRVLAFDPDRAEEAARSALLPLMTVGQEVDCGGPDPWPPLVARNGTVFVPGASGTGVFALEASLDVLPGWPFASDTPLEERDGAGGEEGLDCPSQAEPAVGPDGALYMPLGARNAKVGGHLVAVDPNGRVRTGWPVELKRPGSEFWSVVVGPDGTVYALAIEPEAGKTSSASILAIAPDSTVGYTTTIIDP